LRGGHAKNQYGQISCDFRTEDMLQEEEAFAQKQQEAKDARYEVALRVIWVTLSIACAVLGTVLLGILLR